MDDASGTRVSRAHGLAERRFSIPNTPHTRFAIASGVKGMTALAVMRLVEENVLELDTKVRDLLEGDLPLVDDAVTVEHLLAHRSGIGDYLDESMLDDVGGFLLDVPVHRLMNAEDYLEILDGRPQVRPPDEAFAYNNSGYVVLAIVAERAAGVGFHELVAREVLEPAGMDSTAFLRSDELPGDAAVGYLSEEGLRSNIHHLPIRGCGDGGIYTNATDIALFWIALFAGEIVSPDTLARMVRRRSVGATKAMDYGLGFWLVPDSTEVMLEGYDAGVSFRSRHDPVSGLTQTVMSNTSEGAWPVARGLLDLLRA